MGGLSLRLSTIASLVPKGAKVCDIGTDHGFLAVFLKQSGKVKSVIAADINEKPLEKARENIEKSGVFGIELRLSDGLSCVEAEEFDTAVIAGIGGEVISGIIERSLYKLKNKEIRLVLQPTTSPEILRRFLYENGFAIEREIPILEKGKLYSVMLCAFKGEQEKMENGFYFSGLLECDTAEGRMYIEKQKDRCFKCMSALENIPEKKKEYEYYKSAFLYLDKRIKYGV